MKSSWALGVSTSIVAGAIALFLTQCGDSNLGTALGDGGSTDGATGDAAGQCPANPPTPGTSCTLPQGTLCNAYPQPGCECCGNSGYECLDGKWEELANANGVAPGCPADLPEAGTTCYSGGCGANPTCSFTCESGGNAQATCLGGTWSIETLGECGDAGADAGDASDAS